VWREENFKGLKFMECEVFYDGELIDTISCQFDNIVGADLFKTGLVVLFFLVSVLITVSLFRN